MSKEVRLWEIQGEEAVEGRSWAVRRNLNVLAETLEQAVRHVRDKYPNFKLYQVVCRSTGRDVEWAETE